MGLFSSRSSSSSSSDTITETNYTDRRLVNESGLVATEGASVWSNTNVVNNTNVQALDADIVKKALDTVAASDATNGEGFSRLLESADRLFSNTNGTTLDILDAAERMFNRTTDAASSMAGSYTQDVLQGISRTTADRTGSIDQKTMIVLGVAGAVALVAINMRK